MQRPDELHFVETQRPHAPARLAWEPVPGAAAHVLFATDRPFPPGMAGPLFAGKLSDFVHETRLSGDATTWETDDAAAWYAVLAVHGDDEWTPVSGLRDAWGDEGPAGDAFAFTACTQTASYVRCRWSPPPDPATDDHVDVYVLDTSPTSLDLDAMLAGEQAATHQVAAEGDGFVDTDTELDWRKHYGAVAVAADGTRRPLTLEAGGFVRLKSPRWLADDGPAKQKALVARVVEQLDMDLRRKSIDGDALEASLERAWNLAPGSPDLARIARALALREW